MSERSVSKSPDPNSFPAYIVAALNEWIKSRGNESDLVVRQSETELVYIDVADGSTKPRLGA